MPSCILKKMNSFLFVIPEERFKKKSHYFFTDYLSKFFKLDYLVILKDFDKEFLGTPLNSNEYDGIIFWGEIFDTRLIQKVKNKNVIFVPMMDWVYAKKLVWWYRLRDIKIICFTKFLFDRLLKHNFNVVHFQYYKEPKALPWKPWKELNIFTGEDFLTTKKNAVLNKLFKKTPYKIHNEIKEDTHVFVSLNKFEGVEKELIEAVASGLVLVGNAAPGISDYVQNNMNGCLYKMDLPLSLNLSNISTLRLNSIEKAKIGATRWKVLRKKLVDFLL